jgi:hypothetical protein
MELKWFVYILRFYDFGVLARARRILTPTVGFADFAYVFNKSR